MIVGSIIVNVLSTVLGGVIGAGMAQSASSMEEVIVAAQLSSLIILIPFGIFFFMPVAVKRAHDIGHKGTLIIAVWCFMLIAQLMVFVSIEVSSILSVVGIIPALIYGCILLFRDSERGTNEYGTSTKYPG